MNSFGKIFRITSFGESHGPVIGGVIDGVPAGQPIDIEQIQYELNRRRPGKNNLVSQRNEADKIEILSGIFEGKSLGSPIAFIVRNNNHNSADYENIKHIYRPSHADYTYDIKYGIRDYRGGGRASARETIARVVAGSIARQILAQQNIFISAFTSQIGNIYIPEPRNNYSIEEINQSIIYCPHKETSDKMEQLILQMKAEKDSIGGIIECRITGCPAGIGSPIYDKLHAQLAVAMMSINAVKGFDYGSGFNAIDKKGSELNDSFYTENGQIHTHTNHSGGIQGGISNGEDIYMRIAFKPTPTLPREITTIDKNGNQVTEKIAGRHDPCIVPRAVPIVESMAAIVILDNILLAKTEKI